MIPEHSSASTAKRRLQNILAIDRCDKGTRQPTARDLTRRYILRLTPVLLLDRFTGVQPLQHTGQLIKWRKLNEFN